MAFDVGSFDYTHGRGLGDGVPRWGEWEKETARSMGASDYQMYQLQERAAQMWGKGNKDKVWNYGQYSDQGSPWDYAGHGNYGFGMADVHAINDLKKVKEYKQWGAQHGLNIGAGVSGWIRDQETQQWQKDLAEQQAQQAAEQLRIQQEIAAEAARVQAEQYAQSQMVRSSAPTGVGGAASIRGSRLSITKPGGRSGTRQFARPSTQYLNTLGIGSNTQTSSPVTI